MGDELNAGPSLTRSQTVPWGFELNLRVGFKAFCLCQGGPTELWAPQGWALLFDIWLLPCPHMLW